MGFLLWKETIRDGKVNHVESIAYALPNPLVFDDHDCNMDVGPRTFRRGPKGYK